jgi:uncharacterized protein YbbC (DUF1343 family)
MQIHLGKNKRNRKTLPLDTPLVVGSLIEGIALVGEPDWCVTLVWQEYLFYHETKEAKAVIQFGLDLIGDYPSLLGHKRLALVTNPSAVNASFVPSYEVIGAQYSLVALFGPEHGLFGEHSAGSCISSKVGQHEALPVFSLYRKDGQHLTEKMVEGVDAILFDIQDLGLRFYTYIATLKNLIEDCAQLHKELIVLDRPNPLGGHTVEGNILDAEFYSFVGPYSLPIRYGLTIGELALLFNDRLHYGCELTILPMNGWHRNDMFDALHRPWIMTSPAIGHFESALLYAGMCLFEGTDLSEGRGTSCPFELIGAPYIEAEILCKKANSLGQKGIVFTPAHFNPTAGKYQGIACRGLYAHVLDTEAFRPVEMAIRLISLLAQLYPKDFHFLPPQGNAVRSPLENLAGITPLSLLVSSYERILAEWNSQSCSFRQETLMYHLYA